MRQNVIDCSYLNHKCPFSPALELFYFSSIRFKLKTYQSDRSISLQKMGRISKRAIRVAGASGGYTDRQRAIHDLAKECELDVITGGEISARPKDLAVAMKSAIQPARK